MSLKQVQKLIEKLEDALQDVEIDLGSAVEERNDYELRLAEKTEELETLLNVLASAVGSLTNPTKIEATFKSVLKSTISRNMMLIFLLLDQTGKVILTI